MFCIILDVNFTRFLFAEEWGKVLTNALSKQNRLCEYYNICWVSGIT